MRQFTMKDSYSFDLDQAGMEVSYRKHYDAYCRIFERCGLKYHPVEAASGPMGGTVSHEFVVFSDARGGCSRAVSVRVCSESGNGHLAALPD